MSSPFSFEVLQDSDPSEAVTFCRRIYESDLGCWPADSYDSRARHFVARDDKGQVVAACRLLGPWLRPFDLESRVDIDDVVGRAAHPALVGRLCVDQQVRHIAVSLRIHLGLLAVVVNSAMQDQITDLLLYSYPRLRSLYLAGGFEDTGVAFAHDFWGEVILMRRRVPRGEAR